MKGAKLGWKVWAAYLILSLLPLVVTTVAVVWFLPEKIPAHYGASGEVDRWGSKYESFIFPLLIIPFSGLMFGTAKAASMEIWQSNGTGRKIVLACGIIGLLIFNAVNGFFLYTSWAMVEDLGEVPDIGLRILFLVLSLLIVALGLWMPIVKRNAWFGVRTKWTMESETVWAKSQKFGGKLFAAAGLVSFVSVIFPMSWMMGITCVSVFVAAIASALYSRWEGLREKSEKTNNKL